jgi:hypothetical protein
MEAMQGRLAASHSQSLVFQTFSNRIVHRASVAASSVGLAWMDSIWHAIFDTVMVVTGWLLLRATPPLLCLIFLIFDFISLTRSFATSKRLPPALEDVVSSSVQCVDPVVA